MSKYRSFWLGLAFLAACNGDVTQPSLNPADAVNSEASVRTGASIYHLARTTHGWEGEIDFEFTNVTDRLVSLSNCNGLYGVILEKWQGSDWKGAWSPIHPRCQSSPIELHPGQTRHDTIGVFGGFPESNGVPQFEVDEIDGIYRLVIVAAFWAYDHDGPTRGELIPLERRASNAFEIRTE